MLPSSFFQRDALRVAKQLLGKVIRVRYQAVWLAMQIIETEAYYKKEKASHASLGFTEKRKALFMPAGTIYMYYARGADSLNISCQGAGNAVLIKSGVPYCQGGRDYQGAIAVMQHLNPTLKNEPRPVLRLGSGQTLLCRSLGLKVTQWNQKQFDPQKFFIADVGYRPKKIIQTTRLGIPLGRDEHLWYRFIDFDYALYCSSNPLSKKNWQEGKEYRVVRLSLGG